MGHRRLCLVVLLSFSRTSGIKSSCPCSTQASSAPSLFPLCPYLVLHLSALPLQVRNLSVYLSCTGIFTHCFEILNLEKRRSLWNLIEIQRKEVGCRNGQQTTSLKWQFLTLRRKCSKSLRQSTVIDCSYPRRTFQGLVSIPCPTLYFLNWYSTRTFVLNVLRCWRISYLLFHDFF